MFDKLSLQDGKTLTIVGTIRAVAPNPKTDITALSGIGYVGMNETIERPQAQSYAPRNVPLLNEESVGVLGIKNLELGNDGVLTSDGKVVKLESGSQIMLQVEVTGGE